MENGSEDSHHKHTIDNGNDKKLIVVCEDPTEGSNMNKRILALEKALQELGCHFVKYQEDVAGILVEECSRLTQQMNEQKEKIQRRTHDQVQNALSRAREDMLIELNAELKRRLESSPLVITKCKENVSRQETGSTAATEDLDMTAEQLRKSMNEMRKEISEVYAGSTAATGLVMTAELRKLMNEMRKEINEVHTVLSVRAGATERRLEELESGIAVQPKQAKDVTESTPEAKDVSDSTHVDVCLSEQWNQLSRSRAASQCRGASPSPAPVPKSMISVERQIDDLIKAHSPSPKMSRRIGEVNKVLEDLAAAVTKACPAGSRENSTEALSRSSNPAKLLVPSEAGCKTGSVQLPIGAIGESEKSGSMQFRVPGGSISVSMPKHAQSSGEQPRQSGQQITTAQQSPSSMYWRSVQRQVAVSSPLPNRPPACNTSLRGAIRGVIRSRASSPCAAALPGKDQGASTPSVVMRAVTGDNFGATLGT